MAGVKPPAWERRVPPERGRLARSAPEAWAFRHGPSFPVIPAKAGSKRESASWERRVPPGHGRLARIGRGDPAWQA